MKDCSGWRARIGLIYMASSTVMEPEFYAMAPDGVATCTVRTRLAKMTLAGLETMMGADEVERCTRYLARADIHVIAYGGTSATFIHGPSWDETVKARMASSSGGIPVTTTSGASIAALRAVGAKRISFISPYVADIVDRGRRFFSQSGFEVLNAEGMEIDDDHTIGFVPLERVYDFTRKKVHREADGVFISCTNLRSVGAIAALEQDLGIPVVSAVQATFWDCLRIVGIGDGVHGFGRLFECRRDGLRETSGATGGGLS